MLSLRAVEPNRLRIFDADGVGQDVCACAEGGVGGHEAGEEGVSLVGHDVCDWDAGLVEGGLDDGVVLNIVLGMIRDRMRWQTYLWVELELHEVTGLSDNIVGPKG